MKRKKINLLILLVVIYGLFFIKIKDTKALECTWYLYQSYLTEDDEIINYTNVTMGSHKGVNANPIYAIVYKSDAAGKNFRLFKNMKDENVNWNSDGNVEKFSDISLDSQIEDSGVCPEYVQLDHSSELDMNIHETTKGSYSRNISYQYLKELKYEFSNGYYMIDDITLYSTYGQHIRYFYFTSENLPYPNEHLNEMMNNYGATVEQLQTFHIDTSETSHRKTYYEATKSRWEAIANKAILELEKNNDTAHTRIVREAFSKWFSLVSRFIFEEDYDLWMKYNIFSFNLDEKEQENMEKIFGAVIKKNELSTEKSEAVDNNCRSLCPYNNETAKSECEKSVIYKNCYEAQNKCKGIGSAAAKEQCLKVQMGDQEYNNFLNSYKEYINELDNQMDKCDSEIKSDLKAIEIQSIKGVEFGPYKANCDDVAIFHTLYNILRISAPIIVILLGVVDYGMAVFASDEKKMEESKKKFPKRLLLLVLFVAVPTIVSIILDISGGDANLMRCVINGK